MKSFQDILGLEELKTSVFFKAVIAELLGTAILVLVGCGSIVTLAPNDGPRTMNVAFAFGLGLAMVIWIFGHVSGAHVNPSVSIGMMITGRISILKCLIYICAQSTGGILGALAVWGLSPESWQGNLGSTVLVVHTPVWKGVLVELIATYLLVTVVFASCDRERTDHSGSIALAIGFCVTANIAWTGSETGGSMNPARSLGPAVVSGTWDDHWLYWVSPITGGIIAALLYEYVFAEKKLDLTDNVVKNYEYDGRDKERDVIKQQGFLDYTIYIAGPQESGRRFLRHCQGCTGACDINKYRERFNLQGDLDMSKGVYVREHYGYGDATGIPKELSLDMGSADGTKTRPPVSPVESCVVIEDQNMVDVKL